MTKPFFFFLFIFFPFRILAASGESSHHQHRPFPGECGKMLCIAAQLRKGFMERLCQLGFRQQITAKGGQVLRTLMWSLGASDLIFSSDRDFLSQVGHTASDFKNTSVPKSQVISVSVFRGVWPCAYLWIHCSCRYLYVTSAPPRYCGDKHMLTWELQKYLKKTNLSTFQKQCWEAYFYAKK